MSSNAGYLRYQFRIILLLGIWLFGLSWHTFAQDPFEIHVYQYEELGPGQFTLEQHSNYVGKGTNVADGAVAPTNDQLHIAFELTAGIGKGFSIGVMQLTGVRPSINGAEFAGSRILPRFDAPKSWRLPMDVGLDHSRAVEIRPILEKHFGRVQLAINPAFERALRGPATIDGWVFSPAARLGYQASKYVAPSLEFYSSIGPLRNPPPLSAQFHQLLPGADIRLRDHLLWSVGLGVGLTSEGNRLVYKSRLEWEFGCELTFLHKTPPLYWLL